MTVTSMSPSRAEDIGLQALLWLAGQDELTGHFLASTGAAVEDLRTQAKDPGFLGAILDFLLTDDSSVLAFSADAQIPPEAVATARALLPGGDLPHWT